LHADRHLGGYFRDSPETMRQAKVLT
jgi:hypothetical protein